jgi:hypothetical protein
MRSPVDKTALSDYLTHNRRKDFDMDSGAGASPLLACFTFTMAAAAPRRK